jgi:CDP-diglyceride synthetase
MNEVITMYVTLMPIIFAGILNMIWCRLPIAKKWQIPMDMGTTFKDGKRIFGDNKTWKGFFGYIWLSSVMYVLWGAVSNGNIFLKEHNYFYHAHTNNWQYNLLIGALLGIGYGLFELPNSFLKHCYNRINIFIITRITYVQFPNGVVAVFLQKIIYLI